MARSVSREAGAPSCSKVLGSDFLEACGLPEAD